MDINEQANEGESPKVQEESPEERDEVMVYINFRRKFKEERNIVGTWYIINKDWLRHWKTKHHYYTYKHSYRNQYRSGDSYSNDLSKVNNEAIIIDTSSYLKLKDDNRILIHPNHHRNLGVINETVWNYFIGKYQGGPEIKFEIKEGLEDQLPEYNYLKINFILLPLKNEIPEAKENAAIELKEYTIYMKLNPTLAAIKEMLINITIDNNLFGAEYPNNLLTNENVRLWSLQDQISLSYLQNQFESKKEEIAKPDAFLDPSDFYLNCMDTFLESKYDKFFRKEEITFCLERRTPPPLSQFIFEMKEMKMGRCGYDDMPGVLTICCKCKLIWYCSEICMKRDKDSHELNCPKSLELDEEKIASTNNNDDNTDNRTNGNTFSNSKSHPIDGLCGLSNLGNTCFMNTSLQCLSNCFPLTEYFINDKYKKDLNEDNPLGSKGLIARVYGHFLKNLWLGNASVFTPHHFKQALGSYLKMFSGFQQHDTQEFLNYLLDVLHEDLNRVLKKPSVELSETTEPDAIKSKAHWIAFLKRNQSVFVDLFYGQFKSTLTCPMNDCRNISITFDPFLSLSLPLVSKVQAYSISCYFIFHDVSLSPLFFQIPFYKDTTFMAFRNKIGKMLNIHPWSFTITIIKKQNPINELISETKSLYNLASNDNTKYFLFQIDPKVFYSPFNLSIKDQQEASLYEKDFSNNSEEYGNNRSDLISDIYSENYEEDSRNKIEDLSSNYSLSKEIVPTIVQFMDKVSDYIVFPRSIFLNKAMSIREVYLYIYTTYYDVMCKPKKQSKRYHFDDSPERESNDDKDKAKPSTAEEFENIFKDINDKEAFNEAFDNNVIPFYILYLPRNRSTKKEKLYCFNKDINEEKDNDKDKENIINEEKDKDKDMNDNHSNKDKDMNDNDTNKDKDCEIKENNINEDKEKDMNDNYTNVINDKDADKIMTLETYVTKFNNEPDNLCFSVNSIFSLGIVWNRNLSHNTKLLQNYSEPSIRTQQSSRRTINIYECFDRFVKEEVLEENNEWYCPKCKEHRRATKKIEIYKIPKFLIIHLKRFNNKTKLDSVVDFPIKDLDIAKYVISDDKDTQFDLVAIANHYGSMSFGHYIAFAKNQKKDEWYEFDDSRVSSRDEDSLVSSSAYVLFYSKKSNSNVIGMRYMIAPLLITMRHPMHKSLHCLNQFILLLLLNC